MCDNGCHKSFDGSGAGWKLSEERETYKEAYNRLLDKYKKKAGEGTEEVQTIGGMQMVI